jgi:colicin import membrane protein
MPRRLKTYQTSVGFFDLAIAAPSMKAAAEAWGSDTVVFKKGFAKETDDPIAATMAKPGVLLKRPVGSNGRFGENAELPQINKFTENRAESQPRRKEQTAYKVDDKTARDAALAFEREQKRRELTHRKEEAAREKERKRREQAIAKAEKALEEAIREHEAEVKKFENARATLDKRYKGGGRSLAKAERETGDSTPPGARLGH